jgi:hypothetical protein
MRKLFIILIITSGLSNLAFGQGYIPMSFTQPPVLTAVAGHDTLVCHGHPVILGGIPTASGGSGSYIYMWSPPDGLSDPTSANPVATLTESKSYMLTVTDAQGCEAVSFISVYIDPCTGINYDQLNSELKVFPNPSNGTFLIHGLNSFNGNLVRIDVVNQLGQIIFNQHFGADYPLSQIEIDTKITEPGVYFLKVTLANQILSKRLIVR